MMIPNLLDSRRTSRSGGALANGRRDLSDCPVGVAVGSANTGSGHCDRSTSSISAGNNELVAEGVVLIDMPFRAASAYALFAAPIGRSKTKTGPNGNLM